MESGALSIPRRHFPLDVWDNEWNDAKDLASHHNEQGEWDESLIPISILEIGARDYEWKLRPQVWVTEFVACLDSLV